MNGRTVLSVASVQTQNITLVGFETSLTMEARLQKLEFNFNASKSLIEVLTIFENYEKIIKQKDEEIRDLKKRLEIETARNVRNQFDFNHFLENPKCNEIATTIWSHLDPVSLKNCRRVCKSWNTSLFNNFGIFWDLINMNITVNTRCSTLKFYGIDNYMLEGAFPK